MAYPELHNKARDLFYERIVKPRFPKAIKEHAIDGNRYDIYDPSGKAWEIWTIAWKREGFEADEYVLARLYRYLTCVRDLTMVFVSQERLEEIPVFHRMEIGHWHYVFDWNLNPLRLVKHKGKNTVEVINRLNKEMEKIAPLTYWSKDIRRAIEPYETRFERITKRLGLPRNFLRGLWRDWHLTWVWDTQVALREYFAKKRKPRVWWTTWPPKKIDVSAYMKGKLKLTHLYNAVRKELTLPYHNAERARAVAGRSMEIALEVGKDVTFLVPAAFVARVKKPRKLLESVGYKKGEIKNIMSETKSAILSDAETLEDLYRLKYRRYLHSLAEELGEEPEKVKNRLLKRKYVLKTKPGKKAAKALLAQLKAEI